MASRDERLPKEEWDENKAEVERILRQTTSSEPAARAAFKRSVRERFLAQENVSAKGSESAPISSSRPEDRVRTDADSMIEDILKEQPPVPAARLEFRASLKGAFIDGSIEARPSELGAAGHSSVSENAGDRKAPRVLEGHWKEATLEEVSSANTTTGSTRASRKEHRRNRRGRSAQPSPISSGAFSWQVATGLLAVAAAVMLIVFGDFGQTVDHGQASWSVAARGTEFEVDRVRMSTEDGPQLVKAVNNGAHHLASLGGFVELELARRLRLGMEPASRMDIPALERQPDELVFQLTEGVLHLMTARDNPEQSIVVQTPHAQVRIRGSVLSIEVFEGKGTCICVQLGEASIEVLNGEHQILQVGSDSTCFVFSDDSTPLSGPSSEIVATEHGANLLAFYDETF
ncbi:MAG: hypothetical protein ACI87A_003913 [Planctomycetota bacterium]|jgi:hypothetical protein